ncbi:hypothetical protein BC941DRAFT_183160 [Chlamydoabsidia padenii]|nr:hypothetical protein BC941DRAFT_183160 [Chlamydoabsidia padenii]
MLTFFFLSFFLFGTIGEFKKPAPSKDPHLVFGEAQFDQIIYRGKPITGLASKCRTLLKRAEGQGRLIMMDNTRPAMLSRSPFRIANIRDVKGLISFTVLNKQ